VDGIGGRVVTSPNARILAAWTAHLGREPDPEELVPQLGAGSLPHAFHAMAADAPDAPALDIDGVTRTRGELDAAAGRFAALLRDRGVARGDVVLLAAPSSMQMVEAYLGILRAGAAVLLANPSYTQPELRHLAEHSGAAAGVAAGASLEAIGGLASELAALGATIDVLTKEPAGYEPLAVEALDPDADALLAYTSGTTGRPKAVPLSHANVLSSIRSVMLAWRWSRDDVLVHSLPLFHQHGLSGISATLLSGARAVIAGKFDAEATCRTIERERGTILLAVPAMYERLVAWDGFAQARLDSLRLMVSGSAPLSPALAERVKDVWGSYPLERYGTTESGLDVSNLYEGERRPGSVGLPLPGIELELVDDQGRPVPDGEDGEIVVSGPQVFAGYRGDAEATAGSFYAGGRFRTGDIGRRDPDDGFVSITGRAKELIISGGMNVYPREIELALEESPAVARAAVVGVPSERWGEEVVAAVVCAPGAGVAEGELIDFVRGRLAPYKRPKRVVMMDELPVNHMGKIMRAELVRALSG
jgi:malonyl-CoA/methylmalonyl-CoA synthetase